MLINGFVEYNNNGVLTTKAVNFDTEKGCSSIESDIGDAIAFALYGKTIYNEIARPEVGVPFIALNIECGAKAFYVARQPEYTRITDLGSSYLAKELYSFKTEGVEYDSLSKEEYYNILKDYIDMEFEELVSILKT